MYDDRKRYEINLPCNKGFGYEYYILNDCPEAHDKMIGEILEIGCPFLQRINS